MFQLREVNVYFGKRHILRDVSLNIAQSRVAVIGSNGSGKSTFLRLLNALLFADSGNVLVDGMETRADPKTVRKKVGFVFQNPDNQIVFPTVSEDLAFGLKNQKIDAAEIARRSREILSQYDLSDLADHPSHLLSGGQKQLLAIAGVLVMRPQCLVLDEPTTLLDLRNRQRVWRAISALDQTVILATHDLELASRCERVLVFDNGAIVADGPPEPAIGYYRDMMQ